MRRLVSLLSVLALSAVALADTPSPPIAPTAPTAGSGDVPAEPEPDAGAGSTESTGDIAKPAPDAPPEKVQEAKEVAKKAELTPIIPSPTNPTRPAFQLYAELDPPILAIGLVYQLARSVKQQAAYCAPNCDGVYINWLDRRTAGFYSARWSRASDVGLVALAAGSFGTLWFDEGFLNAVNDIVVVAESTMSASAFATVMTLAAGRPRPFLYSEDAPLKVRNSADASLSFLSSHTADAFAIATATYIAERRLHPNSNRSRVLLGVGLVGASFVGVARVMAGYHFITDVIGGAVVGTSIGFIVSSLHKSPVKVVPVVNRDETGNVTSAGAAITGSL
jgi:membrane-associated phospholipid phosphatase